MTFTPEEIERYKNDKEFFFRFRHTLENIMNVSVDLLPLSTLLS